MSMSIGPLLGTYNILSRLSVGGMGEVYLAEDTRLDRKVALKVLPPEWGSDPDRLKRFQWEARVLATLNHPNIVTIYSVEQHDDVHFFTMELVEGQTLREEIPARGLPLERFLELAIPLADALAAAHQRGIVHRDVKPGNVMVRPDGRLKVLDFGLAKRGDGDGAPPMPARSEPQTQEGRLMGTVAYMSPEQMAGAPLDHRADVFTLGIVYYEMLTGVRPFEDAEWGERVTARLYEKEPPPAPPDAMLPERLEKIVLRCLERDPDKRYQSAEALREDLTALQLEIVSGSFSSTQIARPDFGRPRRWWLALAAALAVVAAAAAFVLPRWRAATAPPAVTAAEEHKRIAVLSFKNLGSPDDEYFAAGITEEITSRLAAVSALKVISHNAALHYGRVEHDGPQIGRELGADYLLDGTVLWSHDESGVNRVRVIPKLIRVADDVSVWSDRYDRVIDDIFAVQSEISEEVIRQLDIRLGEPERRMLAAAPTANLKAYEAYLRGVDYANRYEPNPENWELAVAMLDRAVRLDPEFALAFAELSRVHSFVYHQGIDRSAGRLARAREAAERALAIDPQLPDGHRALGYYYYWGHGDYERALEEFNAAARQLPNDSLLLEGIAYIRRRQGRFDEAVDGFERAFELNPKKAWLAAELAQTFTHLRRFGEADRSYDRAINLAPDQPVPYQLKALNALRWTGDVERARAILAEMPRQDETSSLYTRFKIELTARNYDEAMRLLNAIESDLIGLESALFPREMSRGTVHHFVGDVEQARVFYERSRRTLERRVAERPEDPRLRSTLGMTYAGLTYAGVDHKEAAIREGLKAVELYPVEKDAFVGPDYLEHLAVIYAWVGEDDAAVDLIERILEIPSGLSYAYLRVNPRWDPLRGHPRFERLLAAAGSS
ncbi:MAG TPA: protein kinase [Thermoanaerobaculia bacterium]|jgi:serine/threonine-protein kinase